jgi:predicted metal-dependent enzyme (double-stranded beta helix superfamily)
MTISLVPPVFSRQQSDAVTEPNMTGGDLTAMARHLASEPVVHDFSPDPASRCWKLIVESRTFAAWVIGWPPGGAIDLHDHGDSAGAVVVRRGSLRETRVVRRDGHSLRLETSDLTAGVGARFDPGCVHDIVNVGGTLAVSVHVYAPRLRSMTYYAFGDGVLDRLHTARYC